MNPPAMTELSTRLDSLPTIKKTHWYAMKRLGIETIQDLFYHFPNRYEDYATLAPIDSLEADTKASIEGDVIAVQSERSWRKKILITRAEIKDTTGTLRVIWFNQRFVETVVKTGEHIRLAGKIVRDKQGLIMQSPAFERSERTATHTGRLVPVYPETTGLTSKFLRWQIATLFQKCDHLPDPIPSEILTALHLPTLKTALTYIHFPKSETQVLLAEKRFAFEDMLLLQLKSLSMKELLKGGRAVPITAKKYESLLKNFLTTLPFELTRGQTKALHEILADLEKAHPMNRLLNGDVGSGKTIVALLAILAVRVSGYQSVLLAPTEVLALQHAHTFHKLLHHQGVNIALLTGSRSELNDEPIKKIALIKAIAAGIPDIVIGTHALLEDRVKFHKLALVVVDEQHRFGVAQRARLQELSFLSEDGQVHSVPHFLSMTATPIPRTLSLTLFGNLDLSLLDEMPAHKKPIITRVVATDAARKKVYAFIQEEVAKGRQAFVILPLVETSKTLEEVKAATTEHSRLQNEIFPDLRIGLLHGRQKPQEKEAVMRSFKNKAIDILVSTAVVEVGIDIPNATVMLIEGTERFGLSQLHQFRGRVGRGSEQSYCFLFPSDGKSPDSARLQALEKHASGFDLAEIDLKLRGPGAFLGHRQSGLPDIAFENLANTRLIALTRQTAEELLQKDPWLTNHPLLKKALQKFEERIHFE